MYPGFPFEMKCRHPEQKLGDCLVSVPVFFYFGLFLFSLRRIILYLVSKFKYCMLSYCNLVTRLTNAEMVVKSKEHQMWGTRKRSRGLGAGTYPAYLFY